ncbi:MAG: hypothetical protein ABI461_04440 [Polyangiaceae bacterium]
MTSALTFDERTVDTLIIDDEKSFRHVGIYEDLKTTLRNANYTFRVLPEGAAARWERALLLNLTFWGASSGGDVLVDDHLPADVVAHAAWHHLAARALTSETGAPLSAEALFLGEAIASAFDVYLVGRLLGHAPSSSFLETQVAAMADAADAAGVSEEDFEALLESIAKNPERAFEELRQLLFDATIALLACADAPEAMNVLARLDTHRFGPLLHHYELSTWVLYAHAYASHALAEDDRVRAIDHELRAATDSVQWLTDHWLNRN